MTTLFEQSQWNSSPVAYWTIKYEYQRSGADMQYRFYWKVWLKYSEGWFYNGLQLKLFLNGIENVVTVKGYNNSQKGWSYEGTTGWYTVPNKTSGTTPFYAQLYDTNDKAVENTSSSYSLNISPSSATTTKVPSSFTDLENPTIEFNNIGGYQVIPYINFYYKGGALVYSISRAKGYYSSPYTFVLTDAEREAVRNACNQATEFDAWLGVQTFIGDTSLGYGSLMSTFKIVDANPTYDKTKVTYEDTNNTTIAVTGNKLHIVQNESKLSVKYEKATANKGATITSYKFTLNGVTKTSTTAGGTVDFGTINSSQNLTLICVVTDSRGNTTKVEKEVTMLEYSSPTASVTLARLNNYEDTTYLTVDATYSSLNNKNTVTIKYSYAKSGGDDYSSPVEIQDNEKATVQCDKNFAYNFNITIKDAFGTSMQSVPLAKGKFPLFIHTDRNAVGVNEYCADDEAFRVAEGVAHFEDGIRIADQNVVDYIVDAGSYNGWNYEKYKSGVMKQWTIITPTFTSWSTWGNNYWYASSVVSYKFAYPFVSQPCINATNWSNSWAIPFIQNATNSGFDIYGARPTAGVTSANAYYYSIMAIGRWK